MDVVNERAARAQVDVAAQAVGQVVGEGEIALAIVDEEPDVGLAFARARTIDDRDDPKELRPSGRERARVERGRDVE